MRIDKVLEELGYNKKERLHLLKQRKIRINDHVVTQIDYNVDGLVDDFTIDKKPYPLKKHQYYMLNKPQGVVSANHDKKQATIFSCLPCDATLSFVGRLDKDTTGLMLITDNGQLCYALTQKQGGVEKEYEVTVNGPLLEDAVCFFANNIVFDDGFVCQKATLTILSSTPTKSQARVIVKEGCRHQIKKMFLCYGVKVIKLKRIRIASLCLDKALKEGEYRQLTKDEVNDLLKERRAR